MKILLLVVLIHLVYSFKLLKNTKIIKTTTKIKVIDKLINDIIPTSDLKILGVMERLLYFTTGKSLLTITYYLYVMPFDLEYKPLFRLNVVITCITTVLSVIYNNPIYFGIPVFNICVYILPIIYKYWKYCQSLK